MSKFWKTYLCGKIQRSDTYHRNVGKMRRNFTISRLVHFRLKVKVKVTQSCLTLCHSMEFSSQEYWSGFSSVQFSCLVLSVCDPMDCNTCVQWVSDAIQPSHLLSSPSPPTLNLSQHQSLFKWISSLHQVAKVLEFQLQHQSRQWIFRTDFL